MHLWKEPLIKTGKSRNAWWWTDRDRPVYAAHVVLLQSHKRIWKGDGNVHVINSRCSLFIIRIRDTKAITKI